MSGSDACRCMVWSRSKVALHTQMQMIAPASLGGLHSRIGDILLVIWCMASIVYDVNRSSVIKNLGINATSWSCVSVMNRGQQKIVRQQCRNLDTSSSKSKLILVAGSSPKGTHGQSLIRCYPQIRF